MERHTALAIDLAIIALICFSLFSAGSLLSASAEVDNFVSPAPALASVKTPD